MSELRYQQNITDQQSINESVVSNSESDNVEDTENHQKNKEDLSTDEERTINLCVNEIYDSVNNDVGNDYLDPNDECHRNNLLSKLRKVPIDLHNQIISELINRGVTGVMFFIDEFPYINKNQVIDSAIKMGRFHDIRYLLTDDNLRERVGKYFDANGVVQKIIDSGHAEDVVYGDPYGFDKLAKLIKPGLTRMCKIAHYSSSRDLKYQEPSAWWKNPLKEMFGKQNDDPLSYRDALEILESKSADCIYLFTKHPDWFEDIDKIKLLEPPNFPSGATIEKLSELFNIPNVGEDLAKSLGGLNFLKFSDHVKPIMAAQGEASSFYFNSIKKLGLTRDLSPLDIDYVVYVAKKYGTRARNILENLLTHVSNIADERKDIENFIKEIGVIHYDIYEQYRTAVKQNSPEMLEKLRERIKLLQDKVYGGNAQQEDFDDPLYSAISYSAFPPAIGLTRNQYDKLNKERPDRRADVPESLDALQYESFSVTTGKFHLEEGTELNLKQWVTLKEAVKKVHAEVSTLKLDEVEIASRLIDMYKEKGQQKPDDQSYLFESMYRYHLSRGGGRLEEGFNTTNNGLMQYKEFIGERMKNDLIKDCLKKWSQTHPSEFAELVKDTVNRSAVNIDQNFARVKNRLEGIIKQTDDEKRRQLIGGLNDFLKDFDLTYEMIKNYDSKTLKLEMRAEPVNYTGDLNAYDYRSDEYYNSPEFISAFDAFVAKRDPEQLTYSKISSDLVSGTNREMRRELDKFKFSSMGGGAAEVRKLEFAISKKKEHGVVGYNMGVCVAPDEALWNDPTFMNCIIFDPESKQANGGVHFLIRENCLCLPGINPSLDLLSGVDNEELFNKILKYATEVKEKLGLEKVLIPVASVIHSNRSQVHEIITKKNYKIHKLSQNAQFSTSPYPYSFQDCFEVE